MTKDEETISTFLQTAYTDERLAMLLAHAQDGKLAFDSCCCLLGVSNAEHALRGSRAYGEQFPLDDHCNHHCQVRMGVDGADEAEQAFGTLGGAIDIGASGDALRQKALIPLILAEIKRRETEAHNEPEARNGDSVVTEREVLALVNLGGL